MARPASGLRFWPAYRCRNEVGRLLTFPFLSAVGGLPFALVLFCFAPCALAKYSGGSGTPADPYRISDHNDLYALADDANDYTKCFILTNDIDLNPNLPGNQTFSAAVISRDINNANYVFDGNTFTGVFDGAGHKITNLAIDTNGVEADYLGLFGYIDSNASVCNLGLDDVNITGVGDLVGCLVGYARGANVTNCSATGTVGGYDAVGGLVGYAYAGSVTDCCAIGVVAGHSYVGGLVGYANDANVSNSRATGAVAGKSYVGGLAGYASYSASVTNCYATGTVAGDANYVGGLLGEAYGATVTTSYATGAVAGNSYVGGLVGYAAYDTNVTGCYATGAVAGNSYVGGLVGYAHYHASMTTCYATGEVAGNVDYVGGLVGRSVDNATVTNCYATGAVTGDGNYVGGLVGARAGSVANCFWDVETTGTTVSAGGIGLTTSQMHQAFYFAANNWAGTTWTIDEGNDYPHLAWENVPGQFITAPAVSMAGSGTVEAPWVIESKDDFLVVCAGSIFWDKHYLLNTNIDLSGVTYIRGLIGYDASNPFTGSFDGAGHIVSNLTIEGKDYLGLFGYIRSDGSVRNLALEGVNITGTGYCVGALVGKAFFGTSVTNCYATGTVAGNANYVGGLVGFAHDANVSNSYATGEVAGNSYVGGFVGHAFADTSVTNCYATGTVNGTDEVGGLVGEAYSYASVTNCYATGAVSGNGVVGGLAGHVGNATVSNSYATGEVAGNSDVGGLVGQSSYYAAITNSYAAGVVTGTGNYIGGLVGFVDDTTLSNCYATGTVAGNVDYIGGLVGYKYSGTVTSSFWDVNTSGTSDGVGNENPDPNGAMGRTTTQMMTLSTFTNAGWDFNNIWALCEGTNYPRLQWQIPIGDMLCPDGVTFVDYSYLAGHWLSRKYGDVNGLELSGDGKIAGEDFALLANWWGQSACGDCSGADYTGDNNVDSFDLALLCDNWLVTDYGDVEGAELTGDGKVDFDDVELFAEQWLTAL